MLQKGFLASFLFFSFFNSYSQTQQETQEWLKNKLEFWSLSPKCGGVDIAVTFSECEMYVKGVNVAGDKFTTIIPIVDVGEITFEKENTPNIAFTNMVIHTKDYAQTILHKATDGLTYEFQNITFQVSMGLGNVNKLKMKQAFAHLSEMCSTSKEPF
ncbi:MAG TPA: hypothetical protein VF691_17230 [Cytophagaceae bacterium]|jgi:hypothetical protein